MVGVGSLLFKSVLGGCDLDAGVGRQRQMCISVSGGGIMCLVVVLCAWWWCYVSVCYILLLAHVT